MAIGFLSNIDGNIIVLGLLFIIFFVLIQLALRKSLKNNNSASIIAFCVSLLAVYGLSRTNFDFSGIFYNIGINDEIIHTIIPIIILAGLIFIFWKVKARMIFVIVGLILIIGSRFVYEKIIVLVVGIVILLIGLFLMYKESRRSVNRRIYLGR